MKLRPFELAIVIIFAVTGLVALLVLSIYQPAPSGPEEGEVVTGAVQIWGTLPGNAMPQLLLQYQEAFESYEEVTYQYVAPDRFEDTLVNALADGLGPDLLLVSHEELVDVRRRIAPTPYNAFPLRDIQTRYIDGAEIFALQDGLQAMPIAVDPLMLYWNRDILANENFLAAPRTWEELLNVQFDALIDRSFDRTVNQAVVAMGEYGNVRNAFGIVSMLMIQNGTAGVTEQGDRYEISLDRRLTGNGNPLRTATDFYTRFSRPANTYYSWNRAFNEDRAEFIGENLTFYFGFASEGAAMERLNPNLNFDIAEVPQGALADVRRTYGRFYGLALMRSTDNAPGARAVMAQFSSSAVADSIAVNSGMVPVTRQTVGAGSNTTFGRIAYQSAGIAYGWLNPDLENTDAIFATMMQDINENRRSLDESINDALQRLRLEY